MNEERGTEEVWAVMGGTVTYAERPTREEAELVLEEQRSLVERFGPASIEQRVAPFRAKWVNRDG